MDTSETYIKMRLQAIGDLGIGVPPSETLVRSSYMYVSIDTKGDWYYDFYALCQLERQDQLQEMLDISVWDLDLPKPIALTEWLGSELFCYYSDGSKSTTDYYSQFTSMEQLWLAFVMKELYKKVRVNGEWVED